MPKKAIIPALLATMLAVGTAFSAGAIAPEGTDTTVPDATAPAGTQPEGTAPTGSEPASTCAEAPAEPEDLRIALFPSLDYAAFYVGLNEGIFEEHGLNVEVEQVMTGTALFSAITSGETDLATNSLTSGIVAITNGIPLKLVSQATNQPTEGNTEVLVAADSPIESWIDLENTDVMTINLQGLFHLGTLLAVESEGGDPSTVNALPNSPTDAPPALEAGRVDAIVIQDPFLALTKQEYDFRVLGNPFSTVDYQFPVGNFWTSIETAESKPELLCRFKAALAESTEFANANPEMLLEVIPTYTELTEDQLGDITLPIYSTEINEEGVMSMMESMLGFEWLTYIPSMTQILADV
jgi:NitT/TauT family transport system substrate-binding protein